MSGERERAELIAGAHAAIIGARGATGRHRLPGMLMMADIVEALLLERQALRERAEAWEKKYDACKREWDIEREIRVAAEERVAVLENLDRYIYELVMSQKTGRIKAVLEEAGLRPTDAIPGEGRAVYQRLRSENRARIGKLEDTLRMAERAIFDAQNIICPEDRMRWIGSGVVLDEIRVTLQGG